MANILIIGASKGIGLEATRRALSCGHVVRALARSANSIGISDANLELRSGDALDPEMSPQRCRVLTPLFRPLGLLQAPT